MLLSKLIDTDKDLIVERYAGGLKLMRPTSTRQRSQTLNELLNLPLNIILLDQNSVIQNINENNAATFGCASVKEAFGKTIRSVYKKQAADFSIMHDKEIISSGKMILKEESCERIDNIAFQAITAKFPWYNKNNEIIGVVGCSIPIGLGGNIEETLQAFTRLNLFLKNTPTATSLLPGKVIHGVYLSQREVECIYHLVYGKTAKMIGKILGLSPRTVETHLNNAKIKLGLSSKTELINEALNSWLHI